MNGQYLRWVLQQFFIMSKSRDQVMEEFSITGNVSEMCSCHSLCSLLTLKNMYWFNDRFLKTESASVCIHVANKCIHVA